MAPFAQQLEVAKLLSEVLSGDRFAIAGGIAVRLHGYGERPTEDLDMFTTMMQVNVAESLARAVDHLEANEYGVVIDTGTLNSQFGRIVVTTPADITFKVEFGLDWREHPTTPSQWGEVINRLDSITSKASALWGRREARDAIDVVSMLESGDVTAEQIEQLLAASDAGFTLETFAVALHAASLHPDEKFELYEVPPAEAGRIRERMLAWAQDIAERRSTD